MLCTLREEEMLCMVTDRAPIPSGEYTDMGNAYRRAMAAKNISMQMTKFWIPAETVPALVVLPSPVGRGRITPAFSRMASSTPEKEKTHK